MKPMDAMRLNKWQLTVLLLSAFLWPYSCKSTNTNVASETLQDESSKNFSPWVEWPTLDYLQAALSLKTTREELLASRMIDTNGDLTRHPLDSDLVIDCKGKENFRTIDGSCNLKGKPATGMAGTPFGRNVREPAAFPVNNSKGKVLISPNPTDIADKLMYRGDRGTQEVPSLNMLAAAWIQFMNHDWFAHEEIKDETKVVSYGKRAYEKTFPSKGFDPPQKNIGPPDEKTGGKLKKIYRNAVTHWWDASQLYGWDQKSWRRVNITDADGVLISGKMRIDIDPQTKVQKLPIDPITQQSISGFQDGWWTGLSFLHHLFVQEHNQIVDGLIKAYPWNSEDHQWLHGTARLINSAILAKIHTVEWTTAILAHPISVASLHANWNGEIDLPAIKTALREFTEENPAAGKTIYQAIQQLPGVVGKETGSDSGQNGVPYALTEEFTSVYRMHPLLPEAMDIVNPATGEAENVSFLKLIGPKSEDVIAKYGFNEVLNSLGTSKPGALTLYNYPNFFKEITLQRPGFPRPITFNMAAVDIFRDRERGIPRYNKFREEIGLTPLKDFTDFVDINLRERIKVLTAKINSRTITGEEVMELKRKEDEYTRQFNLAAEIEKLYEGDIESVDLLVGSLAENTRPEGYGFGETSFQIFILNASRRLLADRFYRDDYSADKYTKFGLDYIKNRTMAKVILDHYPSAKAKMGDTDNAFLPWGVKGLKVPIHKVRNTIPGQ